MDFLMGTPKPKPRVKKGNRDPIKVVEEASRMGDARFQYFVENGRLQRPEPTSKKPQSKNRSQSGPTP